MNPKFETATTRARLTHGPAVFNNSGQIILQANNLGNLFRNYKYKNTTKIKQVLNKINTRYLKNVQNMARQVKKAREYGLSNGNIKHRYMHDYWKWLTQVIPVLTVGQAPSLYKPIRTPLKEIQVKSPKKSGKMSHKERNIYKKLKAKKSLVPKNNWTPMSEKMIINNVPFDMF